MNTERIVDLILAQANSEDGGNDRADEVDVRMAAQDILDEFVVIPRAELPETDRYGDPEAPGITAEHLWDNARLYVARALQQESADAKHNARRDELAIELAKDLKSYGENRVYEGLSTVAKRAIDRIIELENEARDGA